MQTAPAFAARQSPDAPQCALLVAGSRQVPPQLMRPAWQLSAHVSPEQTLPAAQATPAFAARQSPDAPQCVLLVAGSRQVPPQLTRPVWQLIAQTPELQTSPAAHALSQSPQCARSSARFAQLVPHMLWVSGQEGPGGTGLVQATAPRSKPTTQSE